MGMWVWWIACRAPHGGGRPHEPGEPSTPSGPLVLAAFPGAAGSGAGAIGGRGGALYVVTSLEDAGPGSLRECVEAAGPRTCVFAVGGTIALEDTLYVDEPFLTVAGQTAPGGGIQLTNAPGAVIGNLVLVAAHDVVWRYLRFRNQYRRACSDSAGSECGALFGLVDGAADAVIDHGSFAWNQDEGIGVWGNATAPLERLTLSSNLIAMGLDSHSTGIIVGGEVSDAASVITDVDAHHNLIMDNSHRNPLFKGRSGRIVANLFYNQAYYVTQVGGGADVDVIGNTYLPGPLNGGFHEVQAFSARNTDAADGAPSLYLSGNRGWNQPDPTGDQVPLTVEVTGENGDESGPVDPSWLRASPLSAPAWPISVEDPLDPAITPTVGASRSLDCAGRWVANRDGVDLLLVEQFTSGDGIDRLPATESDGGGLPQLAMGHPCADGDADGLPDEWELDHGLSPSDPDDRNDLPPAADGYTTLELFLSGDFPNGSALP